MGTDEPVGAAAAEFFLSRLDAGSSQHGRSLQHDLDTEPTFADSTLLLRFERLRATLSLLTPTPPEQLLQLLSALHDELTGASAAPIASKTDSFNKLLEWLRLDGFRLLLLLLQKSVVHHGRTTTSALHLQASLLRLLRLLWAQRQALAAQQRQSVQHQLQQQLEVQADSEADALLALITQLLTEHANEPPPTLCLEAFTAVQSECFAWASLLLPQTQPAQQLRLLLSASAVLRSWTTVAGSVPLLTAAVAFVLRLVLSWSEPARRVTPDTRATIKVSSTSAVSQQLQQTELVSRDVVPLLVAVMSSLADQAKAATTKCSKSIAPHLSSTASVLTICCLLLSKLILLGVDGVAAALIQRHSLVALIARIMRRDLEGGFGSSEQSMVSDDPSLTPRLQSAGAHCLAFLLASQTPTLATGSDSGSCSSCNATGSSSFLLSVQRQLLSSSVVPLLQSVLEAAVSPNCPSSFGPMAADVAFALFVIFGAPIGIDAGRGTTSAEPSDAKSKQAASSNACTSASLLTPTFLLSSCRGFFPLLLSLLIRWPSADSQCALCVQSLLSLLLHYPTVADELLAADGFVAQACAAVCDGLLRPALVEALLALLIEIAASATPACAQSVLGGDAGAEVMSVLNAVTAAHVRAPETDPHAGALRDQVDVLSRAASELN